jgi:hypothetical protein
MNRNSGWRFRVAASAIAGCLVTECASAPASAAEESCAWAQDAMDSAHDGVTDETIRLVAEFLASLQLLGPDNVTLMYLGSYVGDAYRGNDPALVLPYVLADVVTFCEG